MPMRWLAGSRPSASSFASPGIERLPARSLRQQVGADPRGAQRPRLRHRRHPERRPAGLHVARRDLHVREVVALAGIAERLAGEGELQHVEPFVGQRYAARHRQAEALELVRRVAHAHADLHAPAADVVEHRKILGESQRMVEGQQADVAGEAHALGPRRHRRGDGNPRRQVAVVDEVMLGEPDEVEPQPVEPRHLIHDRGIERLVAQARFRRIAEIVGDAQTQGLGHRRFLPRSP